MKVVIVGCSRLGARLASVYDKRGHQVSIVDLDVLAFRRLESTFGGTTVIGTGIDEDILISAGIEQADMFIAATNGDNRNIMASQLAKHAFHVRKVMCRIYDPVRADTYRKLGISAICPTVEIADLFLTDAGMDPVGAT